MESLDFDAYRLIGDTDFDVFWHSIQVSNAEKSGELFQWASKFHISGLPEVLKPFAQLPPLNRNEITLLLEARNFYQFNREAILFLLGYYSLPYCYAAAKGVQVLSFSKRLIDDPFSRLFETAQYVEAVAQRHPFSSEWVESVLKFRCLHAAIRSKLNNNPAYDRETYGLPINQEDLCGTLLSFSYLILKGLTSIGIRYSEREAKGWFLLWSRVGALQGLPPELLPKDFYNAEFLEKTIRKRQFGASKEGQKLTQKLVEVLNEQALIPFLNTPAQEVIAAMVGSPIAKYLGLPKPKPITYLKMVLTGNTIRKRILGL